MKLSAYSNKIYISAEDAIEERGLIELGDMPFPTCTTPTADILNSTAVTDLLPYAIKVALNAFKLNSRGDDMTFILQYADMAFQLCNDRWELIMSDELREVAMKTAEKSKAILNNSDFDLIAINNTLRPTIYCHDKLTGQFTNSAINDNGINQLEMGGEKFIIKVPPCPNGYPDIVVQMRALINGGRVNPLVPKHEHILTVRSPGSLINFLIEYCNENIIS